MRKLLYLFMLIMLVAGFSACQKDDGVTAEKTQTLSKADSARSFAALAKSGNTLAARGILTVTVMDSTYIFDAAQDSVAFVNVFIEGKNYFGITAINKAHTMTFGVSAPGYAASNINVPVAGSQFLLNTEPPVQFSLSQSANISAPGSITLDSFSQDSILAKGSFTAYLAKGSKPTADYYVAKGTFSLLNK